MTAKTDRHLERIPTVTDQIAEAGENVRRATLERNELIAFAVAEGMSQRAAARAAGLSHTAVQQILRLTAEASYWTGER